MSFKATINFGFLWNASGEKITTMRSTNYVMSEDGSLFLNASHWTPPTGSVHHSSFLSGRPVACAGTIQVNQGVIKSLTNESGHYLPQKNHLTQVVNMLKGHGIHLEDDVIKHYTSDEIETIKRMKSSGGWG